MRLRRPSSFLLALGGFLLAALTAAEPITIGETRSLDSKILDEERTVMIHLPPSYQRGADRYPVLFLLDGETRFHHTTGTVATLARSGRIPEMIVVALANTDRTRDFVPPWTLPEHKEGWEAAIAAAGGADRFVQFFRDELIPWVDREYRTHPFRVLVGHSFGGLFATHALATAPEVFDAYVAISPTLEWDEGLPLRRLLERFEKGPGLEKFFHVTQGGEGGDAQTWFLRLEEALRHHAPPELRWDTGIFLEESHGSIPLRAVELALDSLYERWPLPALDQARGLEAVLAHFTSLSQEYGFETKPGEALINRFGYRLMGEGEVEKAIAVFEYNRDEHPDSANVHDSLGEALETAGNLAGARDQYERALALGKKGDDPNHHFYEDHLKAVKKKLAGGG